MQALYVGYTCSKCACVKNWVPLTRTQKMMQFGKALIFWQYYTSSRYHQGRKASESTSISMNAYTTCCKVFRILGTFPIWRLKNKPGSLVKQNTNWWMLTGSPPKKTSWYRFHPSSEIKGTFQYNNRVFTWSTGIGQYKHFEHWLLSRQGSCRKMNPL